MRAAVYRGKGDLRVEDVPIPAVGPGEMLVRVEACGICGTDVKKIVQGLLPGPRIFGHEICGTVARTGAGVTRFGEGDRVVLHHHAPCRRCFYCSIRAYAQCEAYKRNGTTAGFEAAGGGFAQYVKARDWIVDAGAIPVPGLETAVQLVPALQQTTTGACPAGASYWDIGVYGDTGPSNHSSGFSLLPTYSVLTVRSACSWPS